MRCILVDIARSRGRRKRGGNAIEVELEDDVRASPERGVDVVAVDEALTALSAIDPRKGRVVELRYFGGLTVEETAEVLQVSADTVMRDWKVARLWLLRALQPVTTCPAEAAR